MKKGNLTLLLAALLLVTLALAQTPTPPEEKPAQPPVREIKMTAKKYEFNPSEIHVKQGERVRLIIVSLDRTHGMAIKEYGIEREIAEGGQTTVEFTADKAGRFEFKCAKWCGFGHGGMRGILVVEPADAPPENPSPEN